MSSIHSRRIFEHFVIRQPIMPFVCRVFLALGLSFTAATGVRSESPVLLQQLTTAGVQFPNGKSVVLQQPSLSQSTNAESRQAKLEQIAGGIGWQRFSRNSNVAPIEIDMAYVKDDAGNRIGHLVYVAFVVHTPIERLRDRDLMQATFGSPKEQPDADEYQAEKLTKEKLAKWGVTDADDGTSYSSIGLPLLDRVLVQGVIQTQQTGNKDQVAVSWILDPRFSSDASSPPANRWSQVSTEPTEWHAYEGAGGYMHVTRLSDPPGSCFIETRNVIHEPTEWFHGSNLLRSKLPLMIQESVRKFRRQLSETSSAR